METNELIASISNEIGALASTYAMGATPADLYEAALFAIAVKSVRDAGATDVDLVSVGPSTVFRKSPGNLWSPGFTYAIARFPASGRTCEVHLGVFVVGESGVPHECDVALLDGQEAERSRQGQVHPRKTGLIAAIEAKHYAASPGIGVGRAFIGLAAEMGHARSNLAFPAEGAPNLMRLLARRSSQCFESAIPGEPPSRRLASHLEQVVRNWRARAV